MMTAAQLKASILQLAMQGKLVPQIAEEGTGEELYQEIQKEKQRLIKEGKIKKGKKLAEITEEEKPFEIPESWKWARFSGIVEVINGDRGKNYPAKSTLTHEGIPFISAVNLDGETVIKGDSLLCVSQQQYDALRSGKTLLGDIIVCIRGSLGKHGRYPFQKGAIASSLVICRLYFNNDITAKYIMRFLDASLFFEQIKLYDNGTAQPNLAAKSLEQFVVPLPPLAEQQRIVAKIEELMPLVEQYDGASTKLNALNEAFPELMKKSILQEAVQGRLVPQDPSDEPASALLKRIAKEKQRLIKEGKLKKQKPLPAITEEEKPFEIPESWAWVRVGELVTKVGSGSTPTGGKAVYKETGVKFLRSQNVYNDGLRLSGVAYISEEINNSKRGSIVHPKDVLLNITGASIGRCAIVPDDFDVANVNQHVCILRMVDTDIRQWVHAVITSPYIQGTIMNEQVGVSREGLSAEKIKRMVVPIPSINEQKRIVAKLKEVLPRIQSLKGQS